MPAAPVPPRRRGHRVLWASVAAATAVVLTAGGITAYTLLAGTSVALDAQVPADVAAYVEASLDPPAGQKVAALRFFRHFPDAHVGADSGDLIDSLIEPLITNSKDRRRFTENIKPWLGKHVAVAADPQGAKAETIVVVESTDAGKARSGLAALDQDSGTDDFGYVVKNDVVVLARTEAVAQAAVDDAGRGSLHGNDTFRGDIKAVGDGVFTAWVDLSRAGALATLNPGLTGSDGDQPKVDTSNLRGRFAASVRFSDTTADLLIRGFGVQQSAVGEPVGARLAKLPDDTAAAVALSGGDQQVRTAYDEGKKAGLDDELSSLERELGLTLPDDAAALVGSSTVVAVSGTAKHIDYGMVSRTDDVAGAQRAAERLTTKVHAGDTVTVRSVADGTVLANSPDYADKLAGSGGLGNNELFRTALPELEGAQFAGYVDLQRTAELADSPLPKSQQALRAVGMTYMQRGDQATMHVRLVVG